MEHKVPSDTPESERREEDRAREEEDGKRGRREKEICIEDDEEGKRREGEGEREEGGMRERGRKREDEGDSPSEDTPPNAKPKLWMVRSGAFDCAEDEDLGGGRCLQRKKYFSNGNRGVIFTARFVSGGVATPAAVKEILHERLQKPGRSFVGSSALVSEGQWLARLNLHGIGPRLLHADTARVVMEFVAGKRILSFLLEETNAGICLSTLEKVMFQLRQLDAMGIHKGELVKPDRHIIIKPSGDPVLIDFERCKYSSSPQNLTQFCQFLVSKSLANALSGPGKHLKLDIEVVRSLCKTYKQNGFKDDDFNTLILYVRGARK